MNNKLILTLLAAGSVFAGTAMAQANDPRFTGGGTQGNPNPELGPRNYSEYAGNSGWKPSDATPYARGTPDNPLVLGGGRFLHERDRRNLRDRDGDGVPDRLDRYPQSRHYQ